MAVDRAAAILGSENDGAETDVVGCAMGMVDVETTPARQEAEEERPSIVPYYAAGIGVMFLLFTMTGAAAGLPRPKGAGHVVGGRGSLRQKGAMHVFGSGHVVGGRGSLRQKGAMHVFGSVR